MQAPATQLSEKSYVKSVEGRWGRCYFFGKDEYIGKSLQNYGECMPDETEYLLSLAETAGKDKLVLDIGANIGVVSQAMEKSGFTVEAFEPLPDIYELLTANFKGRAHNIALGHQEGTTVMPRLDYSQANNYGGFSVGTASKSLGAVQVPVRTLDSFKFENVGLIKIDVEGFEEGVLRGATDTIARCKPVMYIEDDRVEKSASLHAFIASLGYVWEPHMPPLFREKNFFGLKENIWGKNFVSKNIVCHYKG